jgi:hypothetical protein
MEHKFTIVVIAAVLTSLLLAGTILAPIQSYAAGGRGGFPNTSTLKQAVRDGITVSQEHRDQHMNQENLCYRANTCRQSDVGQNTLVNDNSVTGFADQSDNIQQAAAANKTTPTPTTGNSTTPTPTPRTCEECFTTILSSTQIGSIVMFEGEDTLTGLCGILSGSSETTFRSTLLGLGIDITTINDLIACLKASGIVFAP